jgi:DNA-binding transcriptional MocR family regulator
MLTSVCHVVGLIHILLADRRDLPLHRFYPYAYIILMMVPVSGLHLWTDLESGHRYRMMH